MTKMQELNNDLLRKLKECQEIVSKMNSEIKDSSPYDTKCFVNTQLATQINLTLRCSKDFENFLKK